LQLTPKAATAYASSLSYVAAAWKLLDEDCWEQRYRSLWRSNSAALSASFFDRGSLAAAEERLSILSLRSPNLADCAAIAVCVFLST